MADTPGGKKLFGLPRNIALLAIAAGVLLVAFFWWRSRRNAAQNTLPAASDLGSTADNGTTAAQLGGTPTTTSDTGGGIGLSASDLASLYEAGVSSTSSIIGSQEDLIGQLASLNSQLGVGGENLAAQEASQLGALSSSLVGLLGELAAGGGNSSGGGAGGGSTTTPKHPSSPTRAPSASAGLKTVQTSQGPAQVGVGAHAKRPGFGGKLLID